MQVKFLFSLHLTLLSGLLFAQTPEPMRLHIHFSDASEGYLFIRNLLKPVPDTVRFTNNTCSYTADITETTPFVLTDESNKYQLFFAAPGDQLEVQMKRHDMQLTAISGSASMDIYKKLLMMQGPVQQRMEGLQQLAMQEHANRDSIQTLMSAVGNEQNKNFFRFLQENGRSPVSAFLVYSSISNIHSIDAHTKEIFKHIFLSLCQGVQRTFDFITQ